jgi:hypothetical protein
VVAVGLVLADVGYEAEGSKRAVAPFSGADREGAAGSRDWSLVVVEAPHRPESKRVEEKKSGRKPRMVDIEYADKNSNERDGDKENTKAGNTHGPLYQRPEEADNATASKIDPFHSVPT